MCDGKCNFKSESKIDTIWVESEVGEQLKFAVDEDGLNETSKIDEIENEIIEVLNEGIKNTSGFSTDGIKLDDILDKTINATLLHVKDTIQKIFQKYR